MCAWAVLFEFMCMLRWFLFHSLKDMGLGYVMAMIRPVLSGLKWRSVVLMYETAWNIIWQVLCTQHITQPFTMYRLSKLICPILLTVQRYICKLDWWMNFQLKSELIHLGLVLHRQLNSLHDYSLTVIMPGYTLHRDDAIRHQVTLQIRRGSISRLRPGTLTSKHPKTLDNWMRVQTRGCSCFGVVLCINTHKHAPKHE